LTFLFTEKETGCALYFRLQVYALPYSSRDFRRGTDG
jgi:hypothetical protein